MSLSPPRLHSPVVSTRAHRATVTRALRLRASARITTPKAALADVGRGNVVIPLSTVSLSSNFDAHIEVGFKGAALAERCSLIVDSGNSNLIVPRWEDIAGIPNWNHNYQILAEGKEPWGCPANIVRGPISIPTVTGDPYDLPDCIFYACTAGRRRTANFGAACISPWSASGWNTPAGIDTAMQSPLSYGTDLPYAEFDYAAAEDIYGSGPAPKVSGGSYLRLYDALPVGFRMLDIIPSLEWMALRPIALRIGGAETRWPGSPRGPIAMIDTGGGPVFLTDPSQYVCTSNWPGKVDNPPWTSTSDTCESVNERIGIVLGSGGAEFSYTIDPTSLPDSVRGLTLVMCRNNYYMWGQLGMNSGGISALVNSILIDYARHRVGFKPK